MTVTIQALETRFGAEVVNDAAEYLAAVAAQGGHAPEHKYGEEALCAVVEILERPDAQNRWKLVRLQVQGR